MENDKSTAISGYYKLLEDTLDYIECGYRRRRTDIVFSAPAAPLPQDRRELLDEIVKEVAACEKCELHRGRRNTVPGAGVLDPLVMCIGEAPGEEEDKTGNPFVGRAGQYLDKWLDAIALSRNTNCFIGNIIKCRPPNNRDPSLKEMEACLPFLKRQIELVRPKVILSLGRISSQILTESSKGIGALRGDTYFFLKIPVIPTYHPSGVLRNPEYRKPVWDDLRRLKNLLPDA